MGKDGDESDDDDDAVVGDEADAADSADGAIAAFEPLATSRVKLTSDAHDNWLQMQTSL